MVIFTLFFTLGVWLLQQQPALPDFIWAWLLVGSPLMLCISSRSRLLHTARILLIALIACVAGFFHAAWLGEQRLSSSLPGVWQGRDIEVIGVVAGLPHTSERGLRFDFDVESTVTANVVVPVHIYLTTYFDRKTPPLEIHAGERWRFTVRLKQPHGSSNSHSFDFELWALENNIRAVGYVHSRGGQSGSNIRLDEMADGMGYRIESWREATRDKFNTTLGHAPFKSVLTALAIGDQGSIPQSQWQIFTRTGINHLVSISGLHITMLAGMGYTLVYWLWRRSTNLTLRLPARKAAAAAALTVALGYALLSGYGVPAQRTVYMVAAAALALWLNRHFSYSQILSMALMGVLLFDPWAVLAPGFWLSFGAVALIMYVTAHRIDEVTGQNELKNIRHGRIYRLLHEYTTIQWAMTIGLTPLLLGLFQQVSLVSPVANAFAIPLVSLVVVPLALLGAILPLEMPLWLAHIVMEATMIPLEFLSSMPDAVWTQHSPPAWSIIGGMLGVLWILLPAGFPARWLGLLLMLPMLLNRPESPDSDSLRLTIFDVGQGLSVAAQTQNHALLYDTGPDFSGDADSGNRILVPSLRGMGISQLDGLILSHDDIDHTGGTASLLQAIPADWVSTSQSIKILEGISEDTRPVDLRRCRDGTSWNWDGVQFDILYPAPNNDPIYKRGKIHDNDMSCVLRISTGNQHILLTGDIEKRGEHYLLDKHLDQLPTTLLVVPHHGSASSSDIEFVNAILPDYAVFTSGYRNRFNHPRKEIRQRYADSGATLLRSDFDGAIQVEMKAQHMTIERYRITHRHYWTHVPQGD